MKGNITLIFATSFVFLICITGCNKDEGFGPEDTLHARECPETPLTVNHIVGAFYHTVDWHPDVFETPVLGFYEPADPLVMGSHLDFARLAGIDFFIFTLRSGINQKAYQADSALIETYTGLSGSSETGFVLAYNFQDMRLSEINPVEVLGLTERMVNDFSGMVRYFQSPSYFRIDNKPVVIIKDADNLFSENTPALISMIRDELQQAGHELFIVGQQRAWTPPARYEFRLKGAVDAMTHQNFLRTNMWDRWFHFLNFVWQNWDYSKRYWHDNWSAGFIPAIGVSYAEYITEPQTDVFEFPKDEEFFRKYCNIARYTTDERRMVFIYSFNDWNYNSQIEPALSYENAFLDILKSEFKLP